MEILIVAATENEISEYRNIAQQNSYPVDILVTGAGMVPTAFMLGQRLATRRYDAIINIGIAGSFRRDTELGSIIRIATDQFSELGAQNGSQFLTFEEIGLGQSFYKEKPTAQLLKVPAISELKTQNAITVNTVHGDEKSIEKIRERVDPDLESMEGAAVFFVAEKENIPVLQIRSISNYVEERNREAWKISTAINNINDWLNRLSSEIFS